MNRHYTQAPLPFQGQKRRWVNDFKAALAKFSDCKIFVDLFGGSGLLSRMVADVRPDAVVIYNDFDGYSDRIKAIPQTNALLADLRTLLADYPEGKIIKGELREKIVSRLQAEAARGFVDFVTLSSSLLFSSKYKTSLEGFLRETFYNNIRKSDFNADGYLDGLHVVRKDYMDLFRRWRGHPDVCFLIDPPYLSTDNSTYNGYWGLRDSLDVLETTIGTNYFYFTSNKSEIIDLCAWIGKTYGIATPFNDATILRKSTTLNYSAGYTDIMVFKHLSTNH